MISAILRAQFLSLRLRARRRGGVAFSAIASVVFYAFWASFGFGIFRYFANPQGASTFMAALSSGLLFVMLYWQFAPVLSGGFGAALDVRKLLVYPIPRRALFSIEILLRFTGCFEMVILVACAAAGLLRNPLYGLHAAPFIVTGALLFTGANVLFSAGTCSLFQRLFNRSPMRELMMLLFVALVLAPRVLFSLHVRQSEVLRFVPSQIFWPWAAVARLMLRDTTYASAALAAVYVAAAFWIGRSQFERSIRSEPESLGKADAKGLRAGLAEYLFRIPARLIPDPLGALVEKELRTLARIPRFRLIYAMSCFFGLLMYLPLLRSRSADSFVIQNALPGMSLYGLLMLGQITYGNSFGYDRSAVQAYFSWPVRFRDALLAKNIAVGFLLIPQIAVIASIIRVMGLPASFGKMAETLAVMLIASLYWFAWGNICSVRMPRAIDPQKMNQMSNKLQSLSLFAAPFLLLPMGLAYWARSVFENDYVFAALLLFAAILGGMVYRIGLDSAEATGIARREYLVTQLSRSDGPLSGGG